MLAASCQAYADDIARLTSGTNSPVPAIRGPATLCRCGREGRLSQRGTATQYGFGDLSAISATEWRKLTPAREHAESEESGVVGALESPAALAALAVFSVGLAALIWWRPTRTVAAAVAVVAVIAGLFDVIELIRHVSADRVGLAALAGLILVLRLATVAAAVTLLRRVGRRAAATG